MNKETYDPVVRPKHYMGKIEVIDYIDDRLSKEQFEGYLVGNVLKYISRYQRKNGTEDLCKAQWYLDKLIEVRMRPKENTNEEG